jgi:two-component system, LytTR family, response regulator LytT
MNVLIIEDEPVAVSQLKQMIADCCAGAVFYPVIDNVEDAVMFLQSPPAIDIIFMDIHLSDGQSFEIFETIETDIPVIFTTAYDQYAIRAFEVNSIDYLLKPVSEEKVSKAIAKFEKQKSVSSARIDPAAMRQIRDLLSETSVYRENFLVAFKDKLLPVPVKDFAWFEIKNGVVMGTRFDKRSVVLDERSLDELTMVVNPKQFYRVNRQYLVNKLAIKEIAQYFNGKLLATMQPSPQQPVIISREKATAFKIWMSG